MANIIERLIELFGESSVLTGDAVRSRATGYWDPAPMAAKAIVTPRSTQDVSKVMKLCHEMRQTVVVLGGLTGGVKAANTSPDDIGLSLECMDKVEVIDPIGRTAIVQAGCILQVLQEAAEDAGLYFPLDLGGRGSCTIGGNVATNAGGIEVIRYGMMREQVLGLEAVLADGTVISSMNRVLKNNTGYDLKQLFIGSEGTLGVVTRVVVKLREKPISNNTALVGLDSFTQVTRFLRFADSCLGGTLTSYELMSGTYYSLVTEPGFHRASISRDYKFYVVIEARGSDRDRDAQCFGEMLERAFSENLMVDAVVPKSEAERREVWTVRENFEPMLLHKPYYVYDVSLPVADMQNYFENLERDIKKRWPDTLFVVMGHVGDCNLHFFVAPNAGMVDLKHEIDQMVYSPLKELEGSISAEHGIGLEKRAHLSISRNENEINLMRGLKAYLDPKNILGRGRIFES